jgi:hypothetical protein
VKLPLIVVALLVSACTASPTAPDRQAGGPGVFRVSGDYSGRVTQNVAISSLSLTRAPLRIEFLGNYPWRDAQNALKQPTDPHVLTRTELGGISTNDGGVQFEAYVNQVWLPRELRDADGVRTGFGCIDILSFSPTDVNWQLIISVNPIPYVNSTCTV